jgi:hypothetical protein
LIEISHAASKAADPTKPWGTYRLLTSIRPWVSDTETSETSLTAHSAATTSASNTGFVSSDTFWRSSWAV